MNHFRKKIYRKFTLRKNMLEFYYLFFAILIDSITLFTSRIIMEIVRFVHDSYQANYLDKFYQNKIY